MRLSFGRLSCIQESSLRFSFEILAKGTLAQGARLNFLIHPVVIYCYNCQHEFALDHYVAVCPRCHGSEVILKSGTEDLRFLDMEVD